MKNVIVPLVAITLFVAFSGCLSDENVISTSEPVSVVYDADDEVTSGNISETASITLNDNSIAIDGSGATIDGTIITITSAGTYTLRGTLNDGQIRIDTEEAETVKLILSGMNISCSTSAPIYIVNAEKTVISIADGTENSVTDGDSYIFETAGSDEPNAAIFSADDLTINGGGSLTVTARYNDGITSKDDLKITGGSIAVNAVNDGIRGRDSVAIRDGTITVQAGGDGIQSNNDEDAEKGYIAIEGGTIEIVAGADGIQAENYLDVSGGDLTIASGGGSIVSSSNAASTGLPWGPWGSVNSAVDADASASAKGLKAGIAITVSGGTVTIDSSDDSIHSNSTVTINGGELQISSGDDGIHADSSIEMNGGTIGITKCYEGIESAAITINDGTLHIVASDDGINVAGGHDGSSVEGRPGQNSFSTSGNYYLLIGGGYIVIEAAGDGIDANGAIDMTGGVVIVNGPTSSGNGALDYDGVFKMTGGYLLMAGSSGMAMAPSTSSTQYSVMLTLPSVQPAGTMVRIESQDGNGILTFMPTKAYQSVVLCSPELKYGTTYNVFSGGSSSGMSIDGLYSEGSYMAGTQVTTFTISGIVTYAGSSSTGTPGGWAPGGMSH